jgi:hypothetical protein
LSWAHARSQFFEFTNIAASGKNATAIPPIVLATVKRIDALFDIERGINGPNAEVRLRVRREQCAPLVAAFEAWLRDERSRLSRSAAVVTPIDYMLKRWDRFARSIEDGRICLTNTAAKCALRDFAMLESLCNPSSSVCKHWKRVRVGNATRATFPGHRRLNRLRRQVVGTDLMRCAGNNLHSRKDTGFDKAPYRVVCDA